MDPITDFDARFSSPDAKPIPWPEAEGALAAAEIYWLSTVRADGRPHVTPLIGVWHGAALCFSTGAGEQKARNLEHNRNCALTTGSNAIDAGLDLVVEGEAVRVTEDRALHRLADLFEDKYGADWRYEVGDGVFHHSGAEGPVLVFEVAPATVFGFAKGEYGQTRWRFSPR
jgi:general stress protein 26